VPGLGDLGIELVAESWNPLPSRESGLTPICSILCYDTFSSVVWSAVYSFCATDARAIPHFTLTRTIPLCRSQFDPDTPRARLCSADSALRPQLSGTTLAFYISGFRSSNWSGDATCELHSFSIKGPTNAENAERIQQMEGRSVRCDNLRCVRHTCVVLHQLFTASGHMMYEAFQISVSCLQLMCH